MYRFGHYRRTNIGRGGKLLLHHIASRTRILVMSHIYYYYGFHKRKWRRSVDRGVVRGRSQTRRRSAAGILSTRSPRIYADLVPEDPVTLERDRPVTDTEPLRRADWIRRQEVDLIAQAGLGHYYGLTVSSVVVRASSWSKRQEDR
jgi:hypothetical protein